MKIVFEKKIKRSRSKPDMYSIKSFLPYVPFWWGSKENIGKKSVKQLTKKLKFDKILHWKKTVKWMR